MGNFGFWHRNLNNHVEKACRYNLIEKNLDPLTYFTRISIEITTIDEKN